MKTDTYQLIDNTEDSQYEFKVEGHTPKIEYIKRNGKIWLTHTEVPTALEGRGIGSALVKAVLEDIRSQQLSLIPLCPFVAAYIKRHPEWNELVYGGVKIK